MTTTGRRRDVAEASEIGFPLNDIGMRILELRRLAKEAGEPFYAAEENTKSRTQIRAGRGGKRGRG